MTYPTRITHLLLIACLAIALVPPQAAASATSGPYSGIPGAPNETNIVMAPLYVHLDSGSAEDTTQGVSGSAIAYSLDIWTTELHLTAHHDTSDTTPWSGTLIVVPVPLIGRVFIPICTEDCPLPALTPYSVSGMVYASGTVAGQPFYTAIPLGPLEQVWPY